MSTPTPKSTIDELPWPTQLTARVVEPGPLPRIHGYDAEGDLARHYGFVDLLVLALTGELPHPIAAKSVEVAMCFLSPLSVNEGPAHVGQLSRICATSTSASLSLIAIAAAESASLMVSNHEHWLGWLDDPEGKEVPQEFLASTREEEESLARLLAALPAEAPGRSLLEGNHLSRSSAILALLHQAGLRTSCQLQTALLLSWLPCAAAEAFVSQPAALADYPMNLPLLSYQSDRQELACHRPIASQVRAGTDKGGKR